MWTTTGRGHTSRSNQSISQSINQSINQFINQSMTSNIVAARLAERVWCTQFQSSLRVIYFRLSGFQYSLLPIYFRDGPNTCLHYTKVWQKTYPISDTPVLRSAWRSVAPSQTSSPPQPFLCVNRSPIEYCRYLIFSYLIKLFLYPRMVSETGNWYARIAWQKRRSEDKILRYVFERVNGRQR